MKKIAFFLLSACILTPPAFAEGNKPHWGYEGEHGAEHWGDLEGAATCKIGKVQSPINIPSAAAKKTKLNPIIFNYSPSQINMVNNGHTIQINFTEGNYVTIDDKNYQLLQFHFHAPSEEGIDNKRYPMVAHFVHKNNEGQLAVIALLFKLGNENPFLKQVFANMPAHEGENFIIPKLNIDLMFPQDQKYFSFMGSLTTPPCSEGVKWQVLKSAVEISPKQLMAFKKLYSMNARPFQPINERDLKISE